MPINLPEVFVMAQSLRSDRVPEVDGRRLAAQRLYQKRSGIVFLFSALCLISAPGWVPLYTRPNRVTVTHETDEKRHSFY